MAGHWADDFIPSEISDNITYISKTRITMKEKVILPAFNQGIMKTTSRLLRILLLTSIQMSLSSLVPSSMGSGLYLMLAHWMPCWGWATNPPQVSGNTSEDVADSLDDGQDEPGQELGQGQEPMITHKCSR